MTRADMNPPALSRALTTLALMVVSLVLALIVGTVLLVRINSLAGAIRANSEINRDALRVVLAISDCTLDHTPDECRKRQSDRAAAEGRARILAVDCYTRRALAGLPTPEAGEHCTLP